MKALLRNFRDGAGYCVYNTYSALVGLAVMAMLAVIVGHYAGVNIFKELAHAIR